jgi:UPF0716 protein FxsA
MMIIKWLSLTTLMLPFLELAAFIAVAAHIGFGWALFLLLAPSFAGAFLLRLAGNHHIAQVRFALTQGNLRLLKFDGPGALILLSGFLLLIPGYITDIIGLWLLAMLLWRSIKMKFDRTAAQKTHANGVLDLGPEQWHDVPDSKLPHGRIERSHS